MDVSNEALTLPIPNANFIWYCSWASILSAIVAYSRPITARLAIIPASVFTTSILYWLTCHLGPIFFMLYILDLKQKSVTVIQGSQRF